MQKGLFLVITTAIISGISIFLNAWGVKGLDPSVFTGTKNLIVAFLLIGIILGTKEWARIKELTPRQWGQLLLIGLIGGSAPFILFFKGLSMGSGASGAMLHKTMIVWVVMGSIFFLKEKVNWQLVAGAGALLLGNYLLLGLNGIAMSAGLEYIIIATLLWSTEILIAKHALKDMSGTTVAAGRMGFGSILIAAYLLSTGKASTIMSWSAQGWGWVALTSALLLGYVWTFYNGLKDVKASTAVAVLSLGAVITTTLQLTILEKSIGTGQILGGIVILAGAYLVSGIDVHSTFSTAK